jgi:hypothetical protein
MLLGWPRAVMVMHCGLFILTIVLGPTIMLVGCGRIQVRVGVCVCEGKRRECGVLVLVVVFPVPDLWMYIIE